MGTADRPLDASALRDWAHAVVSDLILHIDEINRLNVFPVADSDTGVNMLFTMRAAVVEADLHANSQADAEDVARVAAALAAGALNGARGNSGVILSQILRGIAEVGSRWAPIPRGVSAPHTPAGPRCTRWTGLARPGFARPPETTAPDRRLGWPNPPRTRPGGRVHSAKSPVCCLAPFARPWHPQWSAPRRARADTRRVVEAAPPAVLCSRDRWPAERARPE